jgi:hypothetical protein
MMVIRQQTFFSFTYQTVVLDVATNVGTGSKSHGIGQHGDA